MACEIWFLDRGSNLGPLPWEHGVLVTGSTRKSHMFFSLGVSNSHSMRGHGEVYAAISLPRTTSLRLAEMSESIKKGEVCTQYVTCLKRKVEAARAHLPWSVHVLMLQNTLRGNGDINTALFRPTSRQPPASPPLSL